MTPFSAAVIAEYNPFHKGHEYQLARIKDEFASATCIMSGFAVQRGSVAIFDKYSRARAAVLCGASLVLELPFPWCCSGARDFARAGVHLAKTAGATHLAFGVESDEKLINELALLRSRPEFETEVTELLRKGAQSYPKALAELVKSRLGAEAADAISKPNNILAVEYILQLQKYKLSAYPIRRNDSFASASQLRALAPDGLLAELPQPAAEVFGTAFRPDSARFDGFALAALSAKLFDASFEKFPRRYQLDKHIFYAIKRALDSSKDLETLVNRCVTPATTAAHIRRAAMSVLFDVTPAAVARNPRFSLLLAANGEGRRILSGLRGNACIVTKPADTPKGSAAGQFAFAAKCEQTISKCYANQYEPLTAGPFIFRKEQP